jgi:hypothetical protein
MIWLQGVVVPGHGVASGRSAGSAHNPYPAGTIAMQTPLFAQRGLDLTDCWPGTINLSIAPQRWQLLQADHRFDHLTWTTLHPPETFSFVRLTLRHAGRGLGGWLYVPHPETKTTHFQSASTMEVLAPRIEGLTYGDAVQLGFAAERVLILD